MNPQMKRISAAREWTKSIGLPAVVMALWVAAVVTLAIQVETPVPLQDAIEQVLAVPATETAPAPAQATSASIARAANQANRPSEPPQS